MFKNVSILLLMIVLITFFNSGTIYAQDVNQDALVCRNFASMVGECYSVGYYAGISRCPEASNYLRFLIISAGLAPVAEIMMDTCNVVCQMGFLDRKNGLTPRREKAEGDFFQGCMEGSSDKRKN